MLINKPTILENIFNMEEKSMETKKQLQPNVKEEKVLRELSSVDSKVGGTTWACAITGGIIGGAATAILPTTKCTSRC